MACIGAMVTLTVGCDSSEEPPPRQTGEIVSLLNDGTS
jgi:hypothetical protein